MSRPREVPGFSEAHRARLLPQVGEVPPALLPGPTAQHEFRRFLGRSAGAVALFGAAFAIAGRMQGMARFVALLVPGLLCWWLIVFRFLPAVGQRNEQELAAGYSTFPMLFGALGTGGKHWQKLSWDYRGTWVLNERGQVVSRPDPAFDPPGYYPSPNRPGAYELWTGTTWSGRFQSTQPNNST